MFVALQHLEVRNGVLGIAACALITHWIFNRREPAALPALFALLLLVPGILSPILIQHYGSIPGAFLAFVVYHATLATSIVLYRLSPFHPLARYPGPVLAKISRWYWTLIALRGRGHIGLQLLHDRYGDAVRIGPNELSFRDISVLQPMMGANGLPKGPMWKGRALNAPILALVGLRDNASHTRRRRPWTRAFSTAALKDYEPVIAKRGAQFVSLLAEKKQVDFAHWVHLFTFDFMNDALFGGGSDVMRDNDADGIAHAAVTGFRDSQLFEHLPWLAYIVRYLPGTAEKTKRFRTMCAQRGTARLAQGTSQKDLFYYLSNEDGAEKVPPAKATVISDAGLAIIAGSDTTATVLANLVYCLLAHPDTYARLRAEVDAFYPPETNALDPAHLPQMHYLDAVINEAMRVYPVVPNGSQRAPEPGSGGYAAGEHFIPEWTAVRVPFWSVQRDARNFARPTEFWPDRWLVAEGAGAGAPAHNADAFLSFSFGPRNCVGKNLALLEMKMLVAHMVQRLEMRFADGFDAAAWEPAMRDRFNLVLGELPVVVERRF